MAAFDDPRVTVPPQLEAGVFVARCRDGSVPVQSFFDSLADNLELNRNYFQQSFLNKPNCFVEESKDAIEFVFDIMGRLLTNRDQVPGTIFRHERGKFHTIACPLSKVTRCFGIRIAVYEYKHLNMLILTHGFLKATRRWPESEFEIAQTIVDQVMAQITP